MSPLPMIEGTALRVAVVGDDPLARAGIASQLDDESDVTTLASRDATPTALTTVDVVVWDLGVASRRATEGTPEFDTSPVPVVALVTGDTAAAEALAAGARGVLPREVSATTLRAAVRALASGLVVLDPTLARALPRVTTAGGGASRGASGDELTAREVEVLQRLAEGLPNKLIAQRLGISEHTVKFHVNAILMKLGVASRTEAVVRAARLGLVML